MRPELLPDASVQSALPIATKIIDWAKPKAGSGHFEAGEAAGGSAAAGLGRAKASPSKGSAATFKEIWQPGHALWHRKGVYEAGGSLWWLTLEVFCKICVALVAQSQAQATIGRDHKGFWAGFRV